MIVLLVSNQISSCLLCIFQLLEFDHQDIIEPIEILPYVINFDPTFQVEFHFFNYTIHFDFQSLKVIIHASYLFGAMLTPKLHFVKEEL